MCMTSVRTNDEENKLFKSYAKLHGISLSDAYKQVFLEKTEDEFDLADLDSAVQKFEENPMTHTLEELRKIYDL